MNNSSSNNKKCEIVTKFLNHIAKNSENNNNKIPLMKIPSQYNLKKKHKRNNCNLDKICRSTFPIRKNINELNNLEDTNYINQKKSKKPIESFVDLSSEFFSCPILYDKLSKNNNNNNKKYAVSDVSEQSYSKFIPKVTSTPVVLEKKSEYISKSQPNPVNRMKEKCSNNEFDKSFRNKSLFHNSLENFVNYENQFSNNNNKDQNNKMGIIKPTMKNKSEYSFKFQPTFLQNPTKKVQGKCVNDKFDINFKNKSLIHSSFENAGNQNNKKSEQIFRSQPAVLQNRNELNINFGNKSTFHNSFENVSNQLHDQFYTYDRKDQMIFKKPYDSKLIMKNNDFESNEGFLFQKSRSIVENTNITIDNFHTAANLSNLNWSNETIDDTTKKMFYSFDDKNEKQSQSTFSIYSYNFNETLHFDNREKCTNLKTLFKDHNRIDIPRNSDIESLNFSDAKYFSDEKNANSSNVMKMFECSNVDRIKSKKIKGSKKRQSFWKKQEKSSCENQKKTSKEYSLPLCWTHNEEKCNNNCCVPCKDEAQIKISLEKNSNEFNAKFNSIKGVDKLHFQAEFKFTP